MSLSIKEMKEALYKHAVDNIDGHNEYIAYVKCINEKWDNQAIRYFYKRDILKQN